MSNVVKEYNLIYTDVLGNSNKYWRGVCLADGTGYSEYGRVVAGATPQKTNYPSHYIVEKKYNEKLRKGYEPLKTIKSDEVKTSSVGDLKAVAKKQIKFSSPALESLIDRLVKFNIHTITSNTTIKYDANSGLFSTPLGLVEQEGIDEARTLLVEIDDFVKADDFKSAKMLKAINKYLKLIPQDIGFQRLDVKLLFPNGDAVKKQNDILESLEVSLKSANTAPVSTKTVTEEKVFDLELDVVDKSDPEYLRISKWFKDTNKSMHGYQGVKIESIFKVQMNQPFDDKPGNIQEVAHSTNCANTLSILKSGLKLAPPSTAQIAGKLFGNGVYGTQTASKSLGYTFGRWGQGSSAIGHMFICDFAMGKPYYATTYGCRNVPAGYDSCWALPKNISGLYNDELIVYSNPQVKIKYLLEVK
jgi:poly [ADP-ribose] polymerase